MEGKRSLLSRTIKSGRCASVTCRQLPVCIGKSRTCAALSRVLRPQFCCARDAELKGESFAFRGPFPAAPTMPPAPLPLGGGAIIPAPPAAAPAPGIPHNFQEVVIAGADATLGYWACPAGAAIVRALPDLGWIDASSVLPGHRAAPSLSITAACCPGSHFAWASPVFSPVLAMSELLVAFSPAAMSRAADGLAAVGLWSKAYTHAGRYFEAYEAILPKLPTPSPLELAGPADLVILSPFDAPAWAGAPRRQEQECARAERVCEFSMA